MKPQNRYSLSGFEKVINDIIQWFYYYRLIFVTIAIIGIVVLNVIEWNGSSPGDQLKNSAIIFTCGSIIIGIFYSIINYEAIHYKTLRDVSLAKKTLSFSSAFEWHRDAMVAHLKIIRQLYDKNKHLIDENKSKEFSELLDSDESARSAFVCVFNFLECISLGCDEDILDEGLIKGYFGTVIIMLTRDFEFYINYRRKKNNAPDTWIKLTLLAQKWRQ
jgi:hypothetical protein